ncbi:hypothetical protein VNO77_44732 [Canavalia gladiata]|uniref:Uncharacterized protein n=1 Tax=Canavalia gladiata TaxID=3824 RepID=A0AAN9JWF5_CANGL
MYQALEGVFTDKGMLHSGLDGLISIGCNFACTLNLAIKGYCHISPLAHSLGMKTQLKDLIPSHPKGLIQKGFSYCWLKKGSSEVSQPLLLVAAHQGPGTRKFNWTISHIQLGHAAPAVNMGYGFIWNLASLQAIGPSSVPHRSNWAMHCILQNCMLHIACLKLHAAYHKIAMHCIWHIPSEPRD